jgi:twitching motility protein PilT
MALDFEGLCRFAAQAGASDIFLKENAPPALKINSSLRKLDSAPLTNADLEPVVRSLMTPKQFDAFQEHPDHDVSYNIPDVARFRVNIYKIKGGYALVLRVVNLRIRSFAELGVPEVLAEFTRAHSGLVLVTGATGSGKSTTLAAMIDLINQERKGHIVTIEDPIEYVHPDKNCFVSQREIGLDTASFGAALRASLREAPDIILVGELRDAETMGICLQAAETGHLVFSTLHTPSAAESMERMLVDVPAARKSARSTAIEQNAARDLRSETGSNRRRKRPRLRD